MTPERRPDPAETYQEYLVPTIADPWTRVLLEHAAPQPGERALDVACGKGSVARHVAPRVGVDGQVIAVDINPAMLAVARELPAPPGATIEWREGDAVHLTLPDHAFDLVLCQQGLQFFSDRAAAVREMRRILAGDGRVAISVWQALHRHPVYEALLEATARHLGTTISTVDLSFSLWDADELRALLSDAGFQQIAICPRSLDIRLPYPERLVELTVLGAATSIPAFAQLNARARSALVAAVTQATQAVIERYRDGHTLAFPMAAHRRRLHDGRGTSPATGADRMTAATARGPRVSWASLEGLPFPLGATWVPQDEAWNFAVHSEHAEQVTLLLYAEADPSTPVVVHRLDHLRNKSGPVWHCRLPAAETRGARYYAYQVDGASTPRHHFDPGKVLFDPYARALHFPPGFDRNAAIDPGPNAGRAPLGLIAADRDPFDWGGDDHRPRHEASAIIYELHVRGFTAHPSSGVPADRRGTFVGLVDRIPYLLELGVTVVELMPVFQFDPGEGNYWGYNPISFFAPHHAYAHRCGTCDQHTEFRELVRAFHAAGLEVVLDVVYNHTGEGNHRGPVYSFKGLDTDTYYIMTGRGDAPYADFSGTGNSLNSGHRYVRRMILDSLRYWARDMHVDGFRFDLASVFARRPDGSLGYGDPPIFGDIASDPDLATLRLIAEPWDAAGAYQLGRAFPGSSWAQWNARFRDDLRRFVRGDAGMVPALMQRLYGSDDLFPDDRASAYHPYQSVNFVTCHDGFTLWDLVSYERKRNWANGHDNADGTDENLSSNSGWEGDDGVPPEVIALRKRQAKNFLCLLLLANGTPMLRAGDEFLHTQGGNNNPYNQDNEASWLDWTRLETHRDVFRFARLMIAFRKAHPSLCRSRFWRDDVRWYGVGPHVDLSPASRSLAFCLRGGSQGDDDLYVMVNAYWEALEFAVQEGAPAEWRRVVDTGRESPEDIRDPGREMPQASARYTVGPRSVVVLVRPRRA